MLSQARQAYPTSFVSNLTCRFQQLDTFLFSTCFNKIPLYLTAEGDIYSSVHGALQSFLLQPNYFISKVLVIHFFYISVIHSFRATLLVCFCQGKESQTTHFYSVRLILSA
jgi:hypothetical protein